MRSHLLLLILFAFFVSLVFAAIAKDDVQGADPLRRRDVRRLRRVGYRARLADVSVPAVESSHGLRHASPRARRRGRHRDDQPAAGAQRAELADARRAAPGHPRSQAGRQRARGHPHRRRREGVRRRRGHQRARGADAHERARARARRPARVRPRREHGQAGDCRHQRLCAGRRLRVGDGVHAACSPPTPRKSDSPKSRSA